MELAAPKMLVVDVAGVELVAPKGDVTVEDPPNTELELAGFASELELAPKTGPAPKPLAAGATLAVDAPNAGGLAAPNAGAGLVPNDGTAPKLGAIELAPPVPKMLLLVAATGAAVVVVTGAVVDAPPNENAPVLLPVEDCAAPPNEKLEFVDDTCPKVVVGLAAVATPPKTPDEAEVIVEMPELATLPKGGGAVVGGDVADAANPPKEGTVAAVVVAVPNVETVAADAGAVEVVVDPKANLGAVVDAPKIGAAVVAAGVGATEVAPPKENALVVVVVADDAGAVVGFRMLPAPNEKPPAEVRPVAAVVGPEVDAAMLPNDGIGADAVVVTAADEAVGDRGLKALNPEPLPKVGIEDCVVVRVF